MNEPSAEKDAPKPRHSHPVGRAACTIGCPAYGMQGEQPPPPPPPHRQPKDARVTFGPRTTVREVAGVVTWTMPREDALDLLGWLRHNRPLGMPDRTFDGLLDALAPDAEKDAGAACGVNFQHDSHGYLDDDGRTRVCDGGPRDA